MARPRRTLDQCFWPQVSKTESCWLWTGRTQKFGYGRVYYDGAEHDTHRLSWMIHYGDPGLLCVLHRCDVPACVNPAHLFLGTKGENCTDRHWKGRDALAGACQPKLTSATVVAIREAAAAGVPQKDLAAQYGVEPPTVSVLVCGKTWKQAGGPVRRHSA